MTKQQEFLDMIKFKDEESNRFSNVLVYMSWEEALGSLIDMVNNLDITNFDMQDLENLKLLEKALSVKLSSQNRETDIEIFPDDIVFDDSTFESIDSNFMKSIFNKYLKDIVKKETEIVD